MEVRVSAHRQTVFLLFITLGLVAVSCSDHESPTSPRASTMAAKAAISGTLLAGGEPLANATVRVAASGQSAQTDAAGRFTLADVAPGIVNLEIRGAGVSSTATVSAAPGAVTKVTVTVNRGRSTVTLNPRSDGTEGTIASITAPNFMLQKQGGGTLLVRTDGNTRFRSHGNPVTFGDLKTGQRVEVEGAAQPDGSVLAARVTAENPEDDEDRTPPPTVTGTPPTATATRTPKPEDDDDRTKSPTVTGTRTPKPEDDDRTRTPTVTGTPPTVTPTRTPQPEDEGRDVEGRVGTITGASFVLMTGSGMVTIQTSGATQFRRDGDPASFADIRTGTEVEVQGQVQPDSSVLASRVDIKD
jgi:uncharacterized protein DUF5666/carboxypeptidase family protein